MLKPHSHAWSLQSYDCTMPLAGWAVDEPTKHRAHKENTQEQTAEAVTHGGSSAITWCWPEILVVGGSMKRVSGYSLGKLDGAIFMHLNMSNKVVGAPLPTLHFLGKD